MVVKEDELETIMCAVHGLCTVKANQVRSGNPLSTEALMVELDKIMIAHGSKGLGYEIVKRLLLPTLGIKPVEYTKSRSKYIQSVMEKFNPEESSDGSMVCINVVEAILVVANQSTGDPTNEYEDIIIQGDGFRLGNDTRILLGLKARRPVPVWSNEQCKVLLLEKPRSAYLCPMRLSEAATSRKTSRIMPAR